MWGSDRGYDTLSSPSSSCSYPDLHFLWLSAASVRYQIKPTAYVLPQRAGNLPNCPIPQQFLRVLFELADPKFYESAQIVILVGANVRPSILLSGTRPNICGSLLGQETILRKNFVGHCVLSVPNIFGIF